ncbi:hypothetical protein Dform_00805 [Dehalogenimonas formicexedens]|uniref:Uncharacterized protein n=1 Tax=Dehalogenimonas formicexedens TaxID=1839801 RepID=A0A1P8F6R1_9CHLR|nr:hypothetical protein [Dehalogenimonas formicexedens]APV44153.1 hypothetical protein Dform_00805 [Dehalogenimonas formicexedens]
MKLSKTDLAEVAAYYSTWLGGRGKKRFVRTEDGGAIQLRYHPDLPDIDLTLFTIGEKLTDEQITKLVKNDSLFVVLPYDRLSSDVFALLSKILRRWDEAHGNLNDGNKPNLLKGCQIFVVADIGKDLVNGESQYVSEGFDDEAALAGAIHRTLSLPGKLSSLNPYTLPSKDLRAVLRVYFLQHKTGHTILEIKQSVHNGKGVGG